MNESAPLLTTHGSVTKRQALWRGCSVLGVLTMCVVGAWLITTQPTVPMESELKESNVGFITQNDLETITQGMEMSDVNVALKKTTSQSSTGWNGSSSRAVDGNKNTNYGGNSCTHTNKETNPWWKVDLKATFQISKVVLTNRGDCCWGRLRDLQVETSPNGSTWTNCGSWKGPGGKGQKVTIACSATARWVRIVLKASSGQHYLTLCEVEVMGKSVPGFKLAFDKKRCSNYKINGKWTRTWTKASSAQACLSKCMAEAKTKCNYFAYANGECLFNKSGCRLENWNGWKTYKPDQSGQAPAPASANPSPASASTQTPPTAWPACWIDSYGRGVGKPLSECPASTEKNGALCYPNCRSGYYGVGPVCWERCPSGWNDGGVFCNIWMHTVKASNHGCPWFDKCGLTLRKGCAKCNSGYRNDGCLCTRPAQHKTKGSYGRSAGKPMICKSGLEQDAGLCYPQCRKTYKGIGPVCWGPCPTSHPHQCGALMCTVDKKECKGKLGKIAKAATIGTKLVGIVDELCVPKCGDQRHMICTMASKMNDAASVCPIDVTQCPQAFKCISFLGKQLSKLGNAIGKLMSGGALKDFNSFFKGSEGIKGCIKASSKWFKSDKKGCDVQKDGSFKEFAKCSVPMFKGFFMDDFSMPALYVSIGSSAIVGFIGGGTTFDVAFAFDGTIIFSYTKCNALSTPDLGGGIAVSIGLFGNKNDIAGESYVMAAGAGIPGTKIDANAEVTYSSDAERVIAMGASFGFGAGVELAPVSATCANCNTKLLGCVTTLEEIGLGYLM